jgi:hypothetical protein
MYFFIQFFYFSPAFRLARWAPLLRGARGVLSDYCLTIYIAGHTPPPLSRGESHVAGAFQSIRLYCYRIDLAHLQVQPPVDQSIQGVLIVRDAKHRRAVLF